MPLHGRDIILKGGRFDGTRVGSVVRVGDVLASSDRCECCGVCGAEAVLLARTRFAWINLCRTHSGDRSISDHERHSIVASMAAEARPADVIAAYWGFAIKRQPRVDLALPYDGTAAGLLDETTAQGE
jgi:hypothetical protein